MKTNKCRKLFSLSLVIGIMTSTITGCQVNPTEEVTKGELSLVANENIEITDEQLQLTTIDAYLNLDLDKFKLFGKPLEYWTYEELYDYVFANFEESQIEPMYDSYTGAPIRIFGNIETDKLSISVIEGHSIQVTKEGIFYNLIKSEGCRSQWFLNSFNSESEDIIASICGQPIVSYLDSIYPGLYEKLQEEPMIYLRDGVAMADTTSNESERISLCIVGGNLELWYQDGVINSLTVLFTEE